jgi:hypothetical protein
MRLSIQMLCRIWQCQPRPNLEIYPYLPQTMVATRGLRAISGCWQQQRNEQVLPKSIAIVLPPLDSPHFRKRLALHP